ncbi:hypothetical protein [Thermosulfurimonas dismutans]|uniref:Uncharacterized protein n=1 Tax=Thermosulfurimonas dismutans TaxID=999894 RepID=A0A179D2V0_9BACT|nr:hypothetical protein [Thermosulfurimonas dismutans]OAQ20121.1 Uncharacterized protein TDIS_1747 [Thermosulfurimonas dismutans]
MGKITVGLTPHRLEFLPESLRLMEEHDLIVLEEPPHPKFKDMLEGRVPIEDFVLETEAGFPEYALELYRALKGLYAHGKKILQVEPYLERWVKIQEALAEGREPGELRKEPDLSQVYFHEHETFGRLLEFYGAMKAPFEELVERIKAFAQADACRIEFRDRLRAGAILDLLKNLAPEAKIYIEAGYIHLKLIYYLARGKPSYYKLVVRNLILSTVKARGLNGVWPSPGDGLTSYYLFGKHRQIDEDLLAARSLIYIRLIEKEELKPTEKEPFPHLKNELFWRAFVKELSYEDCRALDAKIRLLSTPKAREVARSLYPQVWQKAQAYEGLYRNLWK